MATYGKTKRSFLPSFSALRGPNAAPKSKNKPEREGPLSTSISAVVDNIEGSGCATNSSDSIDEVASMLLEDTTGDDDNEPIHQRQPYLPIATSTPNIRLTGASNGKPLPQPLALGLNGTDKASISPSLEAQLPEVAVPAIPRRSSKRRSSKPKTTFISAKIGENDRLHSSSKIDKQGLKSSISAPIMNVHREGPSTVRGNDVDAKIQAMLAATAALKPIDDGTLLQGPFTPPKKRRLMENNVFVKVKNVISDRLYLRSGSKKKDSFRDEKLLDPSTSELQELDDSSQGLTSLEIRMNEGENLKSMKISQMTGNGRIRRKPIAGDGKSLRSLKSINDLSSERPHSSKSQATTNSDYHRDEILFEGRSEVISELPQMPPQLPDFIRTPMKSEQGNLTSRKDHTGIYLDSSLSSSPLAESTPRIRLEAIMDNPRMKNLKNSATHGRLSDRDGSGMIADVEVEVGRFSAAEPTKRKEFDANESIIHTRSKKIKKHPSPSKTDLEKLEKAMRNFPPVSAANFGVLPSSTPLLLKDTNTRVFGSVKPRIQGSDLKTSDSIPSVLGRARLQHRSTSTISKPSTQFHLTDDSRMEIDELQWDDLTYSIATRKR